MNSSFKKAAFWRCTAASLAMLIGFAGAAPAQDPSDMVPRDRLVTDAELARLVDWDNVARPDEEASNARLASHLKNRKAPIYFFHPEEVSARVRDFESRYPGVAETIRARADAFIETYGADVTWKQPGADRIGRPHTPNTIRYLARQAEATSIALSYFHSGRDSRYLDFLRKHIRDFVADYEAGETEIGRNDVFERFYAGHRTRNWLLTHRLLASGPDYTADDRIYMLKVFLMHGARLYDDCKRFHWGNHQLHGLAGLFEMSAMYPELPVMRFWNREAKRVILEHIEREIKPDGFQFERASHYFKLDILNYYRIGRIAAWNDIELPEVYHTRFASMFDALLSLAMPTRKLPVLQDAQGEYARHKVANGSAKTVDTNDAAELADPSEADFMSLAVALYGKPAHRYLAADKFPSIFYWLADVETPANYDRVRPETPDLGSVALDSSAYFVMRSGWSSDALYMVVDAGLAKYKPDHTHGGILGLIGYAHGEELLPNYRVRYSDPSYRTLKNSLVKNIAIVDDVLQGQDWISNHARTGFGIWDHLPKPTVIEWASGEQFDFFHGSHNGYDTLGVSYRREVLFFKPFGWLVTDAFESDRPHVYQQIWQGDYTFDAQYNAAHQQLGKAQLHLLQADPARMTVEKQNHFGTNSIRFTKRGHQNYRFSTVLIPQPANSTEKPDIRLFERKPYRQVVVRQGEYRFAFYHKKDPEFRLGEIRTDARFVALAYRNDRLYAALLQQGTVLELADFTVRLDRAATAEVTMDAGRRWRGKVLSQGTVGLQLEDGAN